MSECRVTVFRRDGDLIMMNMFIPFTLSVVHYVLPWSVAELHYLEYCIVFVRLNEAVFYHFSARWRSN